MFLNKKDAKELKSKPLKTKLSEKTKSPELELLDVTLLKAAADGQVDTIKKCIKEGANIEAKNNEGRTALHIACRYFDNLLVVELLLNLGANIHATDHEGNTPLHLASDRKVIYLLLKKGADIYVENNAGFPPFVWRPPNGMNAADIANFHYATTLVDQERIKELEKELKQQKETIQGLQKEMRALQIQQQELITQKMLPQQNNDDSSSEKKNYSPDFKF